MNETDKKDGATSEVDTPQYTAPEAPTETTPIETETVVTTVVEPEVVAQPDSRRKLFNIVAAVIVVGIFLAIFYSMEQSGRTNTGVFDGLESFVAAQETVATVNGEKISGKDLNISMQQISAGAQVQGVDIEDPQVQADIKAQSVEVLINTELLLQEAESRGINVTEEDVQARYETLVTEVGGVEKLQERMQEFDIDNPTLLRDINNELTIQRLLDQIFAEEEIVVTAEDVSEMYEGLGGEAAGLPPLSEIQAQLEAQISTGKEQEIITNFIDLLRTNAEIEVLIEV